MRKKIIDNLIQRVVFSIGKSQLHILNGELDQIILNP